MTRCTRPGRSPHHASAAGGHPLRSILTGLLVACILLAGCAEQRIRDQSQLDIGSGDYDHAIQGLEDGLKQYPDSVPLRSSLMQARTAALANKLASAGALRAAGKLDDAELELERAKAIDPGNARIDALIQDLATERA